MSENRDPIEQVEILPPVKLPDARWTATITYHLDEAVRGNYPRYYNVPTDASHRHLDALLRDVHRAIFDSHGRRLPPHRRAAAP